MKLIWHYTTIAQLETILADQFIKPSGANKIFGIKPVIWFSKNPIWGPTTYRIQPLHMDLKHAKAIEIQARSIGLARIGIKSTNTLISWSKYKAISKLSPMFFSGMEELGREFCAKPKEWYCFFSNLYFFEWKSVELFIDGQWESIGNLGYSIIRK